MKRALPACYLPAVAGARAPQLTVLLAAAGDGPQALIDGCAAGMAAAGVVTDGLYVESALDGLTDGSLLAALSDWLAPLRAGYPRIVLGGISLGGLLALALADAHPALADDTVLLAPYPGNRVRLAGLAAPGGRHGDPPAGAGPETLEQRGWRGLHALCAAGRPPWLGYGHADRFADGQRLMAAALPPARVCTIAGGHDWPTWRALWAHWLAGTGTTGTAGDHGAAVGDDAALRRGAPA